MADNIYDLVQSKYGDIAKQSNATHGHEKEDAIAIAFGYSAEDLKLLPERSNLGLSCGNPVGLANVKEGEIILDLGSGGGIDVLLAARKAGPMGKAIGIDMTKSMIELAEKNARAASVSNVSFIEAKINSVPLPDSSVDCIISNCVINLVPKEDKASVFKEVFRLLKPGGRAALSDILAKKQLSQDIADNMALYVGCVAGASQIADYEEYLRMAGFQDVLIIDTEADLNLYKNSSYLPQSSCCKTTGGWGDRTAGPTALDFNEWVGSFQIYAIKPVVRA